MQRSRHRPARTSAIALLALGIAAAATAQGLKIGMLQIESTPSGAEVELIGGPAGRTPLAISERDIYPNTYADDRIDLYGVVVLHHPGCEPLRHRVTQGDITGGLRLKLDCTNLAAQASPGPPQPSSPEPSSPASSPPLSSPPAFVPAPMPSTTPPASAQQESVPQRRLRQLQVLQELLDEGLISTAEEQRVRRAILRSEDVPRGASAR